MHRLISLLTFCLIFVAMDVTAAPIKIGMSAPLSGPAKALGNQLLAGSRPVFNSTNAAGGINGRPIQLIVRDDQYQPTQTLRNTIQFLRHDRVDGLFSYVGTPTVTKILPLLRENGKVTLYFPFSGAQPMRIPPYSDNAVHFRASYYAETAALVRYFQSKGITRIAVLYQVDAYGRNGWYGVKLALEKSGKSIVSEATYRRGSTFSSSYQPQVQLIMAEKPQAIICIGTYQPAAGFIRDLRARGHGIPVANISFSGAEALIDLVASIPNAADNLVFSHVVPNPNTSRAPAAIEFRKTVKVPTFISFEGFLNAKLLVEILKSPNQSAYEIGLAEPVRFDGRQAKNSVYLSTYSHMQWQEIGVFK